MEIRHREIVRELLVRDVLTLQERQLQAIVAVRFIDSPDYRGYVKPWTNLSCSVTAGNTSLANPNPKP